MTRWEYITSAPTDGSVVLLGEFGREDGPCCYVGRYGLKTGECLIASWLTIPGRFMRIPTHWMPLPDPPPRSARSLRDAAP